MRRQFDVVENPETADTPHRPFLVILQSDLVSGLRSSVIAPLAAREQLSGAQRMMASEAFSFAAASASASLASESVNLPAPHLPKPIAEFRYDRAMPSLTRNILRLVADLVAIDRLLVPAIWNGFALLEYDTGGYLARWFEHSLARQRSTHFRSLRDRRLAADFWPVGSCKRPAEWTRNSPTRDERIISAAIRRHRLVEVTSDARRSRTALPWRASDGSQSATS